MDNNFYMVMINFYWVEKVYLFLKGFFVKMVCVIGFFFGVNIIKIKVVEVIDVIENGVDELDMVMNIGEMKFGYLDKVEQDI